MTLPKVNFVINTDKIIYDFKYFLFNEECLSWTRDIFLQDHNSIIRKIDKLKDKKKIDSTIDTYIRKYVSLNKNKIKNHRDELEKAWNFVGDKILKELSHIMNTDFIKDKDITCNVGIIQIYPRDLSDYYYQVFYKSPIDHSLAVSVHEITHFIYFKKWEEMFPNDEDYFYESPHPYWHLSEMMASIIAGEKKIKLIFPNSPTDVYPEYLKPLKKEGSISIFDFFNTKYLSFKKDGKTIEEFLTFVRKEVEKIKF